MLAAVAKVVVESVQVRLFGDSQGHGLGNKGRGDRGSFNFNNITNIHK